MDKKLKAKPVHLAEFINYTMSMYEECDGLRLLPEDIKPASEGAVNWEVDRARKEDISEKGAEAFARIIDMHAEIIEVIWEED